MTERELLTFIDRMLMESPGYSVFPSHAYPVRLSIAYIEPVSKNAEAIGLDVAFETNRREAAIKALTTGTTQISCPIELVQDAEKTAGFLLFAPYYDDRLFDLRGNPRYNDR